MNFRRFTEVGGADIYINIDTVVAVRQFPQELQILVAVPGAQPGQLSSFRVTDTIGEFTAALRRGPSD